MPTESVCGRASVGGRPAERQRFLCWYGVCTCVAARVGTGRSEARALACGAMLVRRPLSAVRCAGGAYARASSARTSVPTRLRWPWATPLIDLLQRDT